MNAITASASQALLAMNFPDGRCARALLGLLEKKVLNGRRWRTREELHNAVVQWVEHTFNNRLRQRAPGKLARVEYELAFTRQAAAAA